MSASGRLTRDSLRGFMTTVCVRSTEPELTRLAPAGLPRRCRRRGAAAEPPLLPARSVVDALVLRDDPGDVEALLDRRASGAAVDLPEPADGVRHRLLVLDEETGLAVD